MPTTWNAIFLGRDTALQLDPTEGAANPLAENAQLLVNRMFGTSDNPLRNQVHRLETQDSGGTGNTASAEATVQLARIEVDNTVIHAPADAA